MKSSPFLQKAKIHKIAMAGKSIYARIKGNYDPKYRGKFLAIETNSKDVFLGATALEATTKGKKAYPDSIFYLQKIGFDATYSYASQYTFA